MILVDTNVWSELVRPQPDLRVLAWEADHNEELWLSTVVIGELLAGVETLPPGRRKDSLRQTYEDIFEVHHDRIVGFDLECAREFAQVYTLQHQAGRSAGTADTQLAAIARLHGLRLATRNIRHFDGLGIALLNPWQD
jgi:predicted nucleic acid-binding protein